MMQRLAILCPGQGGQHPRMFNLVRGMQTPPATPDLSVLENLIGKPIDQVLEDERALFANRIAQPLIVAATLAVWEALRGSLPEPALIAGYSVGELSAYAVAQALQADQAVMLAARRAELMDACAAGADGQGLLAISGTSVASLSAELAGNAVFLAIETGADSFILGGLAAALAALETRVRAAGAHATLLPVGVASHTPLMQEAAEKFADVLRSCRFADARVPVLSGISGEPVCRAQDAVAALTRQMVQTIRWLDCMDALAEAGITIALELGPGAALSRMLRARHPHIESRSICDFRTVQGVSGWVAKHFG